MPKGPNVLLTAILYVYLYVVAVAGNQDSKNDRPIIGVLAHELYSSNVNDAATPMEMLYKQKYRSYIAASYVKYVEAAGSRVVPIWLNRSRTYYSKMANSVNGILWPGGAADFDVPDGYAAAGAVIYELALEMNKRGDYFPIWGSCLGMELLTFLAADQREHRCDCDSYNDALPLELAPDYRDSKLFGTASDEIINILATNPVTANFHHYCVTEKNMTRFGLMKDWHILSRNSDARGLVFVSTLEHRKYPFYGVIYHPEKNQFEWKEKKKHPHFADAILAAQFLANFFVNEARKNQHRFRSAEEERESLIYNYPSTYTGSRWVFEQCYFFVW